jgi:hypothetical protein
MSEATNLCCVKCNSVLDRATFQGLEVDLCPKCGGLWLDRGEITRAAKLPEQELGRLRGLLTGAKGPSMWRMTSASVMRSTVAARRTVYVLV